MSLIDTNTRVLRRAEITGEVRRVYVPRHAAEAVTPARSFADDYRTREIAPPPPPTRLLLPLPARAPGAALAAAKHTAPRLSVLREKLSALRLLGRGGR